MSVFVLVSGSLWKNPEQRTSSKSGKLFTVCTVKAGSDDTGGGDFWNILIFSESAQLEMLRLEVGDAVSIRGKLKIETYVAGDGTTKISRTISADAAVGLRPVPREKKPRATKPAPTSLEPTNIMPSSAPPFDDDVPFLMEWRG
jgi:hypothetical protein